MQDFDFIRPGDLNGACRFLAANKGQVKIIAGGNDLMIDLRKDNLPETTTMIMEVSHLKELKYIKADGKYIRIGAAATHTQLAASELIRENGHLLAEAAGTVGSPQIRNRGTLAGNIITASPAADTIPALLVLNAILVIRRGMGEREIPLLGVFAGPNQVNIGSDELVTEIYFEKLPPNSRRAFIKLARRNTAAKSRMNIAAIARQNQAKKVIDLRISAGSVTPGPARFRTAEEVLLGKIPDEQLIKQAGEKVSDEMIRQSGYRWSTDYKKPVVEALIVRILHQVLEIN